MQKRDVFNHFTMIFSYILKKNRYTKKFVLICEWKHSETNWSLQNYSEKNIGNFTSGIALNLLEFRDIDSMHCL